VSYGPVLAACFGAANLQLDRHRTRPLPAGVHAGTDRPLLRV